MKVTIQGAALAGTTKHNLKTPIIGSIVRFMMFAATVVAATQLTACSSELPSSPESDYFNMPPDSTIKAELKNARLNCASSTPSECPENIGLIYSNLDGSAMSRVGQCTGFLVGDGSIVATNSHCIPDYLKQAGATCDENLVIRFMPSGNKETVFSCKRIISYSVTGVMDQDYAFFEIAATTRKARRIARDGVKNDEMLQVVKVNPLPTKYSWEPHGGTIVSETCTAAVGSLLNMKSASPWAPTGTVVNCGAIQGNSGSPVLNLSGDAVGILQSYATELYGKFLQQSFRAHAIDLPKDLNPHFQFTNLTCVPDPVTGEFDREKCAGGRVLTMADCMVVDVEKLNSQSLEVSQKWQDALPPIFLYRKVTQLKDLSMQAIPHCVVPRKEMGPAYEKYVEKDKRFGRGTEKIIVGGTLEMKLTPKFRFDREFRAKGLELVREPLADFVIQLEKRDGVWEGDYVSTAGSMRGLWNAKSPLSIRDCTAAEMKTGSFDLTQDQDGKIISEAELPALREPSANPNAKYCQ